MPWVGAAVASITTIGLLMVSYICYWQKWGPYANLPRAVWYPNEETFADNRVMLMLAAFAFGLSVAAVALTANPVVGSTPQLEAYHGLVAGYYVLQIAFVPLMIRVGKKQPGAFRTVKWLLWTCAVLQLAAFVVLADLTFRVIDVNITVAFTFQLFVFLWTSSRFSPLGWRGVAAR